MCVSVFVNLTSPKVQSLKKEILETRSKQTGESSCVHVFFASFIFLRRPAVVMFSEVMKQSFGLRQHHPEAIEPASSGRI